VRIKREHVTTVDPPDYAAVVIAAGAWSGQVRVKNVTLPAVVPIKGHLIGFQLEPGVLGPVRRHGETYVLQRSNGYLIAGSNEQDIGFDVTVDPSICDDIHRRAAQLFPRLEHLTPVSRWIGFRPRPVEGDAPHIGRIAGTNVWLAYGHYRNGILLTPVTAQRVADDVTAK
jgi:glycine oxidase